MSLDLKISIFSINLISLKSKNEKSEDQLFKENQKSKKITKISIQKNNQPPKNLSNKIFENSIQKLIKIIYKNIIKRYFNKCIISYNRE